MPRRWSLPLGLDPRAVLALALALSLLVGPLLASTAAVAGVVPGSATFSAEQTDQEVDALDNVVLEGHERGYDGGIAAITVTLNNTGSDLTADVRVGLEDADGTVLVEQTKVGVVLSLGVNEITFTFSKRYAPENVALVRVTAASSL